MVRADTNHSVLDIFPRDELYKTYAHTHKIKSVQSKNPFQSVILKMYDKIKKVGRQIRTLRK